MALNDFVFYQYLLIFKPNFFIEFKEERRLLLEVIGPELQSFYDDRQIEVIGTH